METITLTSSLLLLMSVSSQSAWNVFADTFILVQLLHINRRWPTCHSCDVFVVAAMLTGVGNRPSVVSVGAWLVCGGLIG